MQKKKFWIYFAIAAPLVLICIVLIYFFGASFPQFDKATSKQFAIPGLDTSFTPQGMEYVAVTDQFLISGYMNNGDASRIYVVNQLSGQTEKYITLESQEGQYYGHAGGIACYNNFVYVSGDSQVLVLKLSDLTSAENGQKVQVIGVFETGNTCDFVTIYKDTLIVGEFYMSVLFKTDQSHHIEVAEGKNYALAFSFKLNPFGQYGLESLKPINAISLPNKVQGLTFTKDGQIFLSCSWGITASKFYTHKNVLDLPTEKTYDVEGEAVPLYILDSSTLTSTLKGPSMSEEAVLRDGKIYILFESNCSKYRFITRTRLGNVYSID